MNNSITLACYDLGKTYSDGVSNIEVFNNITLEVKPAEMVAIVGASGSGKSTLLHLLGGLDKPTAGYVLLNGKNPAELSEKEKCLQRNRQLGFVYQFHHLLPEFTALENVCMPLLIRGDQSAEILQSAKEILTQVGLEKRYEHKIGQLSGGERQRVAIARALISRPNCILADEPTGNLDPHNAQRVLDLFFNLQKQRKLSVVMVTHDLEIAKKAQRVLKIEEGNLVPI